VSPQLLTRWKATVLEELHRLFDEDSQPSPEQARIAELEQLVGRQALELEILKKASRLLPGLSGRNGRSS
jgi:transposase-like protein